MDLTMDNLDQWYKGRLERDRKLYRKQIRSQFFSTVAAGMLGIFFLGVALGYFWAYMAFA